MNEIRNQEWLEDRLRIVWMRGFSDLEPQNRVTIKFGQKTRTRLGSIRLTPDKKESRILINRLFIQGEVPVKIVDAVIAHEITHYLHGFSSPLKRLYRTPHAGGVVTNELKNRGFGLELKFQKKWLKEVWPKFIENHYPIRNRKRFYRRRQSLLLRLLLGLLDR